MTADTSKGTGPVLTYWLSLLPEPHLHLRVICWHSDGLGLVSGSTSVTHRDMTQPSRPPVQWATHSLPLLKLLQQLHLPGVSHCPHLHTPSIHCCTQDNSAEKVITTSRLCLMLMIVWWASLHRQQDSPQFQKLCFQNLLIAILQYHRRCANRQKPFYCFAETRPFYRQPNAEWLWFSMNMIIHIIHDIAGQRSHKYRTPVARTKPKPGTWNIDVSCLNSFLHSSRK